MLSRVLITLGLGLAIGLPQAVAQTATDPVGNQSYWTIFVYEDPKQCWLVSVPLAGQSKYSRDGRPIADVNRGDIYLFVSFWPGNGEGGMGEVSFMGGYEFRAGQPVTVKIGDDSFELFTEGDTAWSLSPDDDRKLAEAMKRGRDAVVTGISERTGTMTQDTFSLIGFTAAYEDASKRCTG